MVFPQEDDREGASLEIVVHGLSRRHTVIDSTFPIVGQSSRVEGKLRRKLYRGHSAAVKRGSNRARNERRSVLR